MTKEQKIQLEAIIGDMFERLELITSNGMTGLAKSRYFTFDEQCELAEEDEHVQEAFHALEVALENLGTAQANLA